MKVFCMITLPLFIVIHKIRFLHEVFYVHHSKIPEDIRSAQIFFQVFQNLRHID